MAYEDFKNLNRRTPADEVLRDKLLNIAEDPKYDGYQQGLASVVYKLFDKKNSNKESAEALHKPIIINFDEMKSTLTIYNTWHAILDIDNTWDTDLADMQLISKFNKSFDFYYVLLTFIVNIHGSFF